MCSCLCSHLWLYNSFLIYNINTQFLLICYLWREMIINVFHKLGILNTKYQQLSNSWNICWNWLYVVIMSHTCFRVNLHSIVAWMSKNPLLKTGGISEVLKGSNRIPAHNHLVHKQVLNHLAKLIKQLSCVMSTYLYGVLDYMLSSCHVRASKWNNIISWHAINESSIIFAKSLPFSQLLIAGFQV